MTTTIKSFTDLTVWQKGHVLVVKIYRLTNGFPVEEKYGLSSQMRKCATSITSNIAEGFGRWSRKEKNQFLSIASGSAAEFKNQLLIARDVGYITNDNFSEFSLLINGVHKMLTGLKRSNRKEMDHTIN